MGRVSYDFSCETVLVTGASRGIGFAVARGFARTGAEVIILSSGTGIHAAAARLTAETGRPCRGLECDITQSAAVKAALSKIGQIDVLVNNAGLERITPLQDPDDAVEDTFRRITDINTNGTFLVTRHAAPKMVAGGRIILTASIWSRVAVPEFSAYVASKHANLGLSRSWAREFASRILVNARCPGPIDSEMLGAAHMSAEWCEREPTIPLARVGQPAEVARLALFLDGEGGTLITGQSCGIEVIAKATGRPVRWHVWQRFLAKARSRRDVWFAPMAEIAAHVQAVGKGAVATAR